MISIRMPRISLRAIFILGSVLPAATRVQTVENKTTSNHQLGGEITGPPVGYGKYSEINDQILGLRC